VTGSKRMVERYIKPEPRDRPAPAAVRAATLEARSATGARAG